MFCVKMKFWIFVTWTLFCVDSLCQRDWTERTLWSGNIQSTRVRKHIFWTQILVNGFTF